MRQQSIGEVLREARESRGWTFADIQRMTKIQARLVQALEYNDFEAIPDQDYTRSFLQRYAEVLDLDASVLLHAYDTKSLVVYYETDEEPDVNVDLRRKVKTKKATKPMKSYLPLIYLLLAAIFILIFVAYIVSQRIQNQAITPPSTSYSVISSTPSSQVPLEQTTETTSSSTTSSSSEASAAKLTTTGGGSNLAVTVNGATKPVEIQLTVTTSTSWISLSDTEIANGATLSPENPTVTVVVPEAVTNTTLTLGVVEGVSVRVAGQELDLSALTDQSGYINFIIE